MKRSNKFNWIAIFVLALLLSGCARVEFAQNIQKSAGYDKKISELSIKILPADRMKHEIDFKSRGGVDRYGPDMKAYLDDQVVERVGIIASGGPQLFTQMLAQYGVSMVEDGRKSQAKLILEPIYALSQCGDNYKRACIYSIWYHVALYDESQVWSGDFRSLSGSTIEGPGLSESQLDRFISRVVDHMEKDGLL